MHKVVLVIRDGWGYRKDKKFNAIEKASTPFSDRLAKEYPSTLIDAAGEAVGLPKGFMGNSEVGHLTIGSGRIIFQAMERIDKSIKDGDFFKNKAFIDAIKNAKKNNSTLHLISLLQVEGVHSHLNHLLALLDLCKKENFDRVLVHAITDGRDAPVHNSLKHIKTLEAKIKKLGFGSIASVSGRYYSMDRDKKWERTRLAYDAIVKAVSPVTFTSVTKTIKESHKEKVTDEFIIPRIRKDYVGIKDKDSVIFVNFRTDRPRQLTKALIEKEFEGWKRKPLDIYYAGMAQYYIPMNGVVAFKDLKLDNLLGKVVANAGLSQFRTSETEKYAHVTYFFNGEIEEPNKFEDRIMIPSLKVATYDLAPKMRANEITEVVVEKINTEKYSLIVVNLANGDMVGHTGSTPAIIKAVETVDACTKKIVEAGLKKDYALFIFADHGNAEDQTAKWRTSHTLNKVEFILVSNDSKLKKAKLKKGKGLKDIAPTALALLGLKKPKEMTGESIILD